MSNLNPQLAQAIRNLGADPSETFLAIEAKSDQGKIDYATTLAAYQESVNKVKKQWESSTEGQAEAAQLTAKAGSMQRIMTEVESGNYVHHFFKKAEEAEKAAKESRALRRMGSDRIKARYVTDLKIDIGSMFQEITSSIAIDSVNATPGTRTYELRKNDTTNMLLGHNQVWRIHPND